MKYGSEAMNRIEKINRFFRRRKFFVLSRLIEAIIITPAFEDHLRKMGVDQ